jgi:hypothetical protein
VFFLQVLTNEVAHLLWQSYEYIFPLTAILLFINMVLHNDHFMNWMVARLGNNCEYRSLLLYTICYAHLDTSLEIERTDGEMDNIVWKQELYKDN